MSAKHHLTTAPLRTPTRPQFRRGSSFGFASILCAATLSGLLGLSLGEAQESDPTTEAAAVTIDTPSQARPLSQEGTVIALSTSSITARSSDGYTQTYLLTPGTAVIAAGASESDTAASYFKINAEVVIVGTSQNGTLTATAVAERHLAYGGGPPMESGL